MDVKIAAGGLMKQTFPQQLGQEVLLPVLVLHLVDYTCCWCNIRTFGTLAHSASDRIHAWALGLAEHRVLQVPWRL